MDAAGSNPNRGLAAKAGLDDSIPARWRPGSMWSRATAWNSWAGGSRTHWDALAGIRLAKRRGPEPGHGPVGSMGAVPEPGFARTRFPFPKHFLQKVQRPSRPRSRRREAVSNPTR